MRVRARSRTAVLVALAVVAVVALAACGDTSPSARTTPTPTALDDGQVSVPEPDDIDPARLAPLAGLQPCSSPPPAVDGDAGPLPLPDESVLTNSSVDGALQSVQGYTERTPVEVMVAYLRLDGWTVVVAEDEVFESEVLLEKGDLRVFAKSQAVCARGSAFVLFGSEDPDLVPTPANQP